MRARLISLGGMLLVFLLAAPVMGDFHDSDIHPADQKLFHGYDPVGTQLVWAAILDAKADDACTLEDVEGGSFVYEIDDDGEATVVGAEGDCSFAATDVTGPQGQVNHGTVVSSFVKALRESGYDGGVGCFVRVIAGTEYGKGEQQIRVGEDSEPTDGTDETTVEIIESDTTCGKPDHAGKPEKVGKPESSGKPAHAGKADTPKTKTTGKPEHAGKPGGAGKKG